ncbi:MAG: hypothetical protein RBS08_08890 [Bdellovibrionales bacterium]|jgi:hypothetical protein|nr:hypothetical protein [Bdellovibrionales bacterium]
MFSTVIRFPLMAVSAAVLALSLTGCASGAQDAAKQASAEEKQAALSDDEKMAPAEGMRLTRLFEGPVKNNDARFKRLEEAVQALRDDVDVFAPTMENRVSTLELSVDEMENSYSKTRAQTEALVKEATKPVGDVQAVRIGDHLDKTRIVLDMSAVPEGRTRIENEGRRLVVELPRFNWKAAQKSFVANSGALVSGWAYNDGQLMVDLIAPATVKEQQVLPAKGKLPARLVIDLFAKGVHQ